MSAVPFKGVIYFNGGVIAQATIYTALGTLAPELMALLK